MSWQQILPVIIVLAVGLVFIWRSSDPKKHEHDAHCGCGHDHGAKPAAEKKSTDHP